MPGTELFLPLAEIAGVFLGFAALIGTRSGAAEVRETISEIRNVVCFGVWVVISAVAPILLGGYGVVGHQLWLACSLFAALLLAALIAVVGRTRENRADVKVTLATVPLATIVLVMGLTFWLPLVLLVLALLLVVLGPLPDREPTLYLTALGLGLWIGALGLFRMITWVDLDAGPDPAGPPAQGGADA